MPRFTATVSHSRVVEQPTYTGEAPTWVNFVEKCRKHFLEVNNDPNKTYGPIHPWDVGVYPVTKAQEI